MANTHAVLEFLGANKAVDWALHPALENHPDYRLAKRLPAAAGRGLDHQLRMGGRRPARNSSKACG